MTALAAGAVDANRQLERIGTSGTPVEMTSTTSVASRLRRGGWWWFLAWAIPGVALGLQVSVIGILVLPAGVLVALLLLWLARGWPELLGVLEGVAGVAFFIALANRDYQPCPRGGRAVGRSTLEPGEASAEVFSCGGVDPVVALVLGLTLAVVGFVAYALLRRSREVASG